MDVTVVAVAAIATGGIIFLGALGTWLRYRSRQLPREDAGTLTQLTDEVRSLRIAVDTMAVEVERLGEEQRYATRLLGERADASR
jgi:hypothetical protein